MPFYKDTKDKVHYLDNEAFAYILPAGSTSITEDEARQLQSKADSDQIKGQIDLLESQIVTLKEQM